MTLDKRLASDEEFSGLFKSQPEVPSTATINRWPLWWSLGTLSWAVGYSLVASALLTFAFLAHHDAQQLADGLLFPIGGAGWALLEVTGALSHYVGAVGFETRLPSAAVVAILSFILALPFGAAQGVVLAGIPTWFLRRVLQHGVLYRSASGGLRERNTR